MEETNFSLYNTIVNFFFFFFFFFQKIGLDILWKLSSKEKNSHEMSKFVFYGISSFYAVS